MATFQDGLKDYVDVAERISIFRDKYPTGCLQPANLDQPILTYFLDGKNYIMYTACAYRTPDDPRPGVGVAWELVPGATSFTRGSEVMNAETAAWGRAIVAVLAADTKRGVASAQEVNNRQEFDEALQTLTRRIELASSQKTLDDISIEIKKSISGNQLSPVAVKLLQVLWKNRQKAIVTPIPPSSAEVLPDFDDAISKEEVVSKVDEIKEQLRM
jgi:hypothetical protein